MTDFTTPLYRESDCFSNAYINQRNCYKDLNLKIVVGSLGINKWFEFGGKCWKLEDFKKNKGVKTWDAHSWLEDKDGNIYDFAYSSYDFVSQIRRNQPFTWSGIIIKKSKNQMKAKGLWYVPADADTQKYILDDLNHMLEMKYEAMKRMNGREMPTKAGASMDELLKMARKFGLVA